MSFRTRLTVVCAVAVAAVVVVVAVTSYYLVRDRLHDQVDASLESSAARLADLQVPEFALPFFDSPAVRTPDYMQIVDADGTTQRPETQRVALPAGPDELAVARGEHGPFLRDVQEDGRKLRVAIAPTGEGQAVQFAASIEDVTTTIDDLRLTLFIMAIGGIVVAAAIALLISRTMLRPLVRLTRAAEHVAATRDLASSIDVRRQDELGRLASSFNRMLAALEASQRQQQQLVRDASHELRTPLTSLRTNIEVLAGQAGMPEQERVRVIGDLSTQIEELTMLMDDLDDLASDERARREETVEVGLADIVTAAADRARLRAPEVEIDVVVQAPARIWARPADLERALVNILDNACKWSPAGARVEVGLDSGTVTVRDDGPGISADDLPHVFDRFYRAPAARALPGSGLGLAIARHVITDHGGSIRLESAPGGGTIVTIELPAIVSATPTPQKRAPERGVRMP